MLREAIVIGSGAREHALVHALRTSGAQVYAIPGNAGIAEEADIIRVDRPQAVVQKFAHTKPLIVVGPEAPLAEGWADILRDGGFSVVGPSRLAAQLESSKRLSKEIMVQCGVPTAKARVTTEPETLRRWIMEETHWPKVLKQSGLAAGKGVSVVSDIDQAIDTLERWQNRNEIWKDGVLFEECLDGYEISVEVLTNGRTYTWLPVAQDYKRLTAQPDSPNTGGMGAMAPLVLEPSLIETINRTIFDPVMRYLSERQWVFRGVLYAGLMVTSRGPMALEFNVRLGDPETEVILPILPVDWFDFWMALAAGKLPEVPKPSGAAVGVVMAAPGYPDAPVSGTSIHLGQDQPHTRIYHGGTRKTAQGWESQGGRVLTVVGTGDTIAQARERAYRRIQSLDFPGGFHRQDIGAPGVIDSDSGGLYPNV